MTIDDLITKGFLPEELPPVFTSEDLSKVLREIIPQIDILDPLIGKKRLPSKALHFSIPKVGGYRRNLSVPNPLFYIRLSKTISDNWAEIYKHTEKSTLSMSRLKLGSSRAIAKPIFDELIQERIIRSAGSRHLLKVDISRFYNSIYTHSIPWALHAKPIAKIHRKRTPHFGNALDEDCRKLQDGQTIGIPVGPDTSRVISEIILSSIDQILIKKLPSFKGVRIIDDYYLYFKNLGDAELARAIVHQTLREYELELNPNKDTIISIPEVLESLWYKDLKAVRFSPDATKQRKELIGFFDKAFYHAKQQPDDAVLSYAISKIRATIFNEKNLVILQSLLLNSIVHESRTIHLLSEILISYHEKKHKFDLKGIKFGLEQFIDFHCEMNNEFEISWALWTMKSLKLKLNSKIAVKLSKINNSIISLVCLDMKRAKLIPKGLNTALWKSVLNKENLYSEHWLLAYEAKRNGWLKTADNYLDDDPFFSILKKKKVKFYKENKTINTTKVKVASNAPSVAEYKSDEDAFDEMMKKISKEQHSPQKNPSIFDLAELSKIDVGLPDFFKSENLEPSKKTELAKKTTKGHSEHSD